MGSPRKGINASPEYFNLLCKSRTEKNFPNNRKHGNNSFLG